MLSAIRRALTRLGESTTHPAAFGVVAAYAVAWLIFSPDTLRWAAIATLATWFMTLFINRTEHRDTEVLHAKIDELLRTHGEAITDLTTLDEQVGTLRSIAGTSAGETCWRTADRGGGGPFKAEAGSFDRHVGQSKTGMGKSVRVV